jgi:hypothetical protein
MNGVRTTSGGILLAVEGIDADAILKAARTALEARSRGGISRWDASGVFQDLAVADAEAGAPSPRTLLLLYAADLAFRLRWQIRPALLEGRTVVAVPYIETAAAFGRAAGLPAVWLANLFRFAPRPGERRFVHAPQQRARAVRNGFVGFSCDRTIGANGDDRRRRRLIDDTSAELRRAARR